MSCEFYPTGQVTFEGGVLVQADKFSAKADNGMKLEATLANKNGTPVFGMNSIEVSWDMKIDNEGPELPWFTMLFSATTSMAIGFKFPNLGVNATFNVAPGTGSLAQNLGDPAVCSCTAKGYMSDATGI